MAQIVFLSGKDKGRSEDIDESAVIGRGDTVDIRIGDAKASREHCRVYEMGGRWTVTDLNSRNGILVNKVAKTRANLSHGDTIAIGQTVMRFQMSGGGGKAATTSSAGGKATAKEKQKAFSDARQAASARPPKGSSGGDSPASDGLVSKRVLQFSKVDEKNAKPWDLDLSQSPVLMQIVYWLIGLGLLALLVWGGTKMMG